MQYSAPVNSQRRPCRCLKAWREFLSEYALGYRGEILIPPGDGGPQ